MALGEGGNNGDHTTEVVVDNLTVSVHRDKQGHVTLAKEYLMGSLRQVLWCTKTSIRHQSLILTSTWKKSNRIFINICTRVNMEICMEFNPMQKYNI